MKHYKSKLCLAAVAAASIVAIVPVRALATGSPAPAAPLVSPPSRIGTLLTIAGPDTKPLRADNGELVVIPVDVLYPPELANYRGPIATNNVLVPWQMIARA